MPLDYIQRCDGACMCVGEGAVHCDQGTMHSGRERFSMVSICVHNNTVYQNIELMQ